LSYPFGWEINGQRPFQIGADNELFFSDKAPYFEKNRFSVSFNFYLSKATVIQLGYMYQFNNKDTSDNIQKYLQIGLYFELSSKHLVNPVNGIHLKDN
jgi:hypothetical protein